MSMQLYHLWHEASVVEMKENHNVRVFKELLMAGDVELNPGPYPQGIFIIVSLCWYPKTINKPMYMQCCSNIFKL